METIFYKKLKNVVFPFLYFIFLVWGIVMSQ